MYRKHKEGSETYVLTNLVHEYYTYKMAKDLFKKNVFPASVDTLGYDSVINPPVNSRRSAGRLRSKRYRQRSLHSAAEDSPILCRSNCGVAGHNRRTCSPRRPGDRTPNSLLQTEEGKDEHEEGTDEHKGGTAEHEEGKDKHEEGKDNYEVGKDKYYEESNDEDEEVSNEEDEETSNEDRYLLN